MNKNRNIFLVLATLVVFIFCTAGMAIAVPDTDDGVCPPRDLDYHRPNPHSNSDPGIAGFRTYDYVAQELGIYDTGYWELGETDCRACHGNSLADRHHLTDLVIEYGICTDCHDPDPNAPGGVEVTRDCTAGGCHSWDVNDIPDNGWHHLTDLSDGNACVVCHDGNILSEMDTYHTPMYPPTMVTPTPFSCENCHWYQEVVDTNSRGPTASQAASITNIALGNPTAITAANSFVLGDEVVISAVNGTTELNGNTYTVINPLGASGFTVSLNSTGFGAYTGGGVAMVVEDSGGNPMAGHPSDFNHLDPWGNNIGYSEYGKPIMHNRTNHHMSKDFDVANIPDQFGCYNCHGLDPNESPLYDEDNPENIRYCEKCHDMYSLHTIYGHVGYDDEGHIVYPGAQYPADAAGWVATGFHTDAPTQSDPIDYDTFNCNGSPNASGPDEMCLACHVDALELSYPPIPGECSGNPVVLSMEPKMGTCEDIITLQGYNFNDVPDPGNNDTVKVEMALTSGSPLNWIEMPIVTLWTDTMLKFRIPCFRLTQDGNYYVRITNDCGQISGSGNVFAYGSWVHLESITPCAGACTCATTGTWLTLSGANFQDPTYNGTGQLQMDVGNTYGVWRTVEFVSSNFPYTGPLVAKNYQNWSTTSVEVQFCDFWVDDYQTEAMFPDNTWAHELESKRNHMLDSGTEQEIAGCNNIAVGTFEVYAVSTYFKDNDSNHQFSSGDMIYQIVLSDPEIYELTNVPVINAVRPRQQEPTVPKPSMAAWLTSNIPCPGSTTVKNPRWGKVGIWGNHFGPSQQPGDSVRIGDPLSPVDVLNYDTDSNYYTVEDPVDGIGLRVGPWSNDFIGVYLYPEAGEIVPALYGPGSPGLGTMWLNKWLGLWVHKANCGASLVNTFNSNIKPVKIVTPLCD